MKITKLGHSCLLIEEESKIIVDPGVYTDPNADFANIDALFFTHGQHSDHFDVNIVKKILENNPDIEIYCNNETAEILKKENINTKVLKAGDNIKIKNIDIKVFGSKHANVYPTLSAGGNLCYLFNNRFFDPGDSFVIPNVLVETLALPISAPWLKLAEAIDYVLRIKPKKCFPIHNFNISQPYGLAEKILSENDIEFITESIIND